MTETLDKLEWHRDPAASGWRSRAFLSDGWELIAYDDGRWEARKNNNTVADGKEVGGDDAKQRVVLVHTALHTGLMKAKESEHRVWEYRHVEQPRFVDGKWSLARAPLPPLSSVDESPGNILHKLGVEGWELCAIDNGLYIFKRPLTRSAPHAHSARRTPDSSRLRQRYCSKTGPIGHEQQMTMTPAELDATFERVTLSDSAIFALPPAHDAHGGRLISGPDDPDTGEGVSVRRCLICGGYLMERELK